MTWNKKWDNDNYNPCNKGADGAQTYELDRDNLLLWNHECIEVYNDFRAEDPSFSVQLGHSLYDHMVALDRLADFLNTELEERWNLIEAKDFTRELAKRMGIH